MNLLNKIKSMFSSKSATNFTKEMQRVSLRVSVGEYLLVLFNVTEKSFSGYMIYCYINGTLLFSIPYKHLVDAQNFLNVFTIVFPSLDKMYNYNFDMRDKTHSPIFDDRPKITEFYFNPELINEEEYEF